MKRYFLDINLKSFFHVLLPLPLHPEFGMSILYESHPPSNMMNTICEKIYNVVWCDLETYLYLPSNFEQIKQEIIFTYCFVSIS